MPAGAEEAADKVRVLVPAPGEAMVVEEKADVTPVGRVLTLNATAAVNPLTRVVVRVMGMEPPGTTLALAALAESVKLGGGATVRLKDWVLVTPPPAAVMVRA